MPKTFSGIYKKIYYFQNLHAAYLKARRCKRYRQEVLKFTANLEENLIAIQNELIWKLYKPLPFRDFYVFDPKERLIQAPAFRDRIIHHALCNLIEPLFDKKFIYDSYACRAYKGTHRAIMRAQKFMQKAKREHGNFYILKADISKYFPSINHAILKNIIRRTIACKDTLWLIDLIIDNKSEQECGLPIGALTSQLFANIYLNEFDHFMKEELSVKFYIRYMDDFIILHQSKDYLKHLLKEAELFLGCRLFLTLNRKTQIFPYKHGLDFCGYRIWTTHILPRKRNIKKAKKMLRKLSNKYKNGLADIDYIRPRLMSFLGYMKHCNGYNTLKYMLSEFVLSKK